ncbi:MAG TPA: serine protease [Mycobacterium sp.]
MQPWIVRAAVALVASAGVLSPTAAADDKVPLGGGAGVVVDGSHCTLNSIGHDNTGELVGFTAAHCGGPGAQVVAEGAENHGSLGTVAAVGDGLDYSVIRFDPAKVSPTANFAGFPIDGIGPDPDLGEPACTLGAATGDQCSHIVTIPGPGPGRSMLAPFQPGDDGRPVTSDDLLIGLVRDGYTIPGDLLGNLPMPETELILFSAILNDINAKGGAGAGFSPIPG